MSRCGPAHTAVALESGSVWAWLSEDDSRFKHSPCFAPRAGNGSGRIAVQGKIKWMLAQWRRRGGGADAFPTKAHSAKTKGVSTVLWAKTRRECLAVAK